MINIDNQLLANSESMEIRAIGDSDSVARAIHLQAIDEVAYPVVLATAEDNVYTNALRTLFRLASVPFCESQLDSSHKQEFECNQLPLVFVGSECVGHSIDVFEEYVSGKFQQRLAERGVTIGRFNSFEFRKLFKGFLPTAFLRGLP